MSTHKIELVFIPTPGMGHLLSTIEFAKLITKNNPTISILVIIFHIPAFSSTAMDAYIQSQSRELDTNRFTFVTLPPLSNPPDPSSPTFYRTITDFHRPLIEQALVARSTKPAAFVIDIMCVNMIDIANDLGVPSYVFFTSGVILLNIILHFQALADDNRLDALIKLSESSTELDLPGFRNKVPTQVMPRLFMDPGNVQLQSLLDLARRSREAKGILVNTSMELESYAVKALHSRSQNNVPTIYPVGPIVMLDGGPHDHDQDLIMRWLDDQPPSSVVFLCFGSLGSFDEEQVKEIAKGLEQSGHRFLWSLRRPSSRGDKIGPPCENETFEDALPEGFLDRTRHIGKIIGWAPQAEILAHQAVGGFMSHCGWNSVLESIWFGVPVATWPIYAEQQLNAFVLVRDLELAVEIRMDYQKEIRKSKANFVVMAEEIKSGVNKVISIDDKMKERIREMSHKCRKGLEIGGSSHECLTRFISDILDHVVTN